MLFDPVYCAVGAVFWLLVERSRLVIGMSHAIGGVGMTSSVLVFSFDLVVFATERLLCWKKRTLNLVCLFVYLFDTATSFIRTKAAVVGR